MSYDPYIKDLFNRWFDKTEWFIPEAVGLVKKLIDGDEPSKETPKEDEKSTVKGWNPFPFGPPSVNPAPWAQEAPIFPEGDPWKASVPSPPPSAPQGPLFFPNTPAYPWSPVPPAAPPPPLPTHTLDPADPFDAVLIDIVAVNRRKRADYAKDGDPFSNFDASSELMGLDGFGPTEAALFNITQKLARLKSLRINGRMNNAANESVTDTYLDLAVYGILTYALHLRERNTRIAKENGPDEDTFASHD